MYGRSSSGTSNEQPAVMSKTANKRTSDRRVVRTKKAIREAFLKLAEEQNYQKVTITALASEADIDRKTFYLHYESVEDVVDELIREDVGRIMHVCKDTLRKGAGTIDVTELFVAMSTGLASDISQVRRIAKHISADEILARMEGPLKDTLLEDDMFGLPDMGSYLDYCVSFFCAGMISVYRRWLVSDSEIPLEKIAEMTRIAITNGLNGIVQESSTLVAQTPIPK